MAGLQALDVDSAQFSADDEDLIVGLTKLHWAGVAGNGSDTAISASGNTLTFQINGTASTLEQVLAAGPTGVSVQGPTNDLTISEIISCRNSVNYPQVLFAVDNILLPDSSEPAPIPDQATVTELTSAGFIANAFFSFIALTLPHVI